MATYKITSPDGQVYRITAPDDATQEQVMAYAQESFKTATNARPLSRTDKVVQGLRDPIDGGAQLLTNMLPKGVVSAGNSLNNWLADKTGMVGRLPNGGVDQQVRQNEAAYQERRKAGGETGFDGYRMLGNVASPANAAIAMRAPQMATLGGRVGAGVVGGGLSGLFNPVTGDGSYGEEKAKQVALGGAFGGVTPAVTGGIARVISPKASVNPNVQLLKAEGVRPTVGQAAGGMANAIEEKAQSLPFVGDAIASARMGAREQFNNAAINRATAPIGAKVSGTGTGAVKDAGDLISDFYNNAKASLGNFQVDKQATAELLQLRNMAKMLPQKERKTFESLYQVYKNELTPQGHLLPDGFKTLDSKLTSEAARFSGSTDAYQKQLGDAVMQMQKIITDNAKRANPKAAEQLSKADKAWANLVRIEGAAKGAKGTEGVFTPGQLLTAVRGADDSVRDRATSRGTALLQDLGSAGQSVLGNRVPDSGTPGRLLWGGLGAAAYADPLITGGGLLGGSLMYTSPVQRLLTGAVSSRPQLAEPAANMFRKAAPALIPGGAQLGLGLLQ